MEPQLNYAAALRGIVTDEKNYVLEQSVLEVVEFSSQYGSDSSMSYTAGNIVGDPTVYPRAGDHAHCFHLRTYGPWWDILPSSIKRLPILPPGYGLESQDFLEIRYRYPVKPLSMVIYETFNPGAIIKILCFCYETQRWLELWQGKPSEVDYSTSRVLTIEFRDINMMTDYYRLEFYHRHLRYYCELDAVCLGGNHIISDEVKMNKPKFLGQKNSGSKNTLNSCYFDILPSEVMTLIMSYLDLKSLCTASKVSKLFHKLCYDPVLYKDLNVKIYWNMINSSALKQLESRLSALKYLNLSWCGGQGRIKPQEFIEFVERNCHLLTSLRLSVCPFVNNSALRAIATSCPLLQELDLRCCRHKDLTHSGFKYISQLSDLTYLDLYRTSIDKYSAIAIIKACPKLEHLLLGSCSNIGSFDEVARAIGKHLKNVKTLDFWRASSLGCAGVIDIAENCHDLVEIDLGWCSSVDANCGCIKQLICNCSKLKKLFLSAMRSISRNELKAISSNLKDLEQLDVLGSRELTVDSLENVLQCCKRLQLLDISFSDRTIYSAVKTLQEQFPDVSIKCSAPPAVDMRSMDSAISLVEKARKKNKKCDAEEITYTARIDPDQLPAIMQGVSPTLIVDQVRLLFEALLTRRTEALQESDLIRFYFHCDELDRPAITALLKVSKMSVEKLLSKVIGMLQSNDTITLDDCFHIDVITIWRPTGAGHHDTLTYPPNDQLQMRSIISIEQDDSGLCYLG